MKPNQYIIFISIISIIIVSGRLKNEKTNNKNDLRISKGINNTESEEPSNTIGTNQLKIQKTHDLFFPAKSRQITESEVKNENTFNKQTIYNLRSLINSEEEKGLLQHLRDTKELINKEKTLVYNGPLSIHCDECEKEFQSISFSYSQKYKSFTNMQGIGMKCDSGNQSYCELYQIAKIPLVTKDTEIAFLDFLESEQKFRGMVLIYLPVSPCSICLSEIEKRMKNKTDVFLHFYYLEQYRKIKPLKMNKRPLGGKIFDLKTEENIYKTVLSRGMKNVVFTRVDGKIHLF